MAGHIINEWARPIFRFGEYIGSIELFFAIIFITKIIVVIVIVIVIHIINIVI